MYDDVTDENSILGKGQDDSALWGWNNGCPSTVGLSLCEQRLVSMLIASSSAWWCKTTSCGGQVSGNLRWLRILLVIGKPFAMKESLFHNV